MRNFLTNKNDGFGFNFFDDFMDDFFKPVFYKGNRTAMSTDIKETENGYLLSVDLPGFDKKDVALSLDSGYLTIEAKREEKDGENYLRRERSYSARRSYYVGEAVTEEDIKAKLDNGTLRVEIPKKEIKELPKKNIAIE